jgi:hypothetical protein
MTNLRMTRRAALGLMSAAPFAGFAGSGIARAQAPAKMKIVGAASVARPDQGFMFVGIPTGMYGKLGVEGDFFTVGGSAQVIQLVATSPYAPSTCRKWAPATRSSSRPRARFRTWRRSRASASA